MLRLEKQREKTARRLAKVKGKLEDPETAVYVRLDENGDPITETPENAEGGPAESQHQASSE